MISHHKPGYNPMRNIREIPGFKTCQNIMELLIYSNPDNQIYK